MHDHSATSPKASIDLGSQLLLLLPPYSAELELRPSPIQHLQICRSMMKLPAKRPPATIVTTRTDPNHHRLQY
ncbi:hypothetical protein L2E82_08255 [Cichorium intybus]|uniref:Uncharacterized protein n=1 Tax=Cichorium intybus TaxID=13427 RepID=A0ACB9G617_CICIN|nr:hypothetical protein L2E82_08255 [Cichorium intybus]